MPVLHVAAENAQPGIIEVLVAHGAPVDAPDDNGWTPLHWAVDASIDSVIQSGEPLDLRAVQCLLGLGADPDARSPKGDTPLTIAAQYRFEEVVALLSTYRRTAPGSR